MSRLRPYARAVDRLSPDLQRDIAAHDRDVADLRARIDDALTASLGRPPLNQAPGGMK